MQLDEEMRGVVDREIVYLLICYFLVKVLAILLDSFHQVQDLIRNQLTLFFREIKLDESVLIPGLQSLVNHLSPG